jgi:phospholipid/cholesterol/gamma-HCH transport system substrate-binding protein
MPRKPGTTKYNETFFRNWGGPGPTVIGAVVMILILIGLWLAFTKELPFQSPGYQLKATFSNSVNISDKAPVRIAGVNVGQVTGLERKGDNSVVTFTVSDAGRPIHDDAAASIRPRIFLEGNFFIDLDPGSPSAADLPDNSTIPVTRTSTAVQLDEILTALQQPERVNLQLLLVGLGTGLTYSPTPADDKTQDPEVKGLSAAAALNKTFDYGEAASRGSAIANEALLGTQPNDLSDLLVGGNRIFKTLASREVQLKGLISNFNTFTGALASQSDNLSQTISLLAPTLRTADRSLVDLNAALPALRGYAIAARPGIAELPATISAALPWLAQAKPLLSKRELGGNASLLARGTPQLNEATQATLGLLPQLTKFNRCVSGNLIPAGNVVLQDNFGPYSFTSGQPNYREFFYSTTGVAGESQNFDGNGSYVRFQPGGGPVTVKQPNPSGSAADLGGEMFGNTISAPLGTRPQGHGVPPIKSGKPCYKNALPNLNGPAAAAGPTNPTAYP